MNRGWRAGPAGEVGVGGARDQQDLVPAARDVLDSERHARSRYVRDRVYVVITKPLIGDSRANVGVIPGIGAQQFDPLAVDGPAEIGNRHSRRLDRPGSADVGVKTRQIGKHTDLDGSTQREGLLARGRACQHQAGAKTDYRGKFHRRSLAHIMT
jgi:hypothetical protein